MGRKLILFLVIVGIAIGAYAITVRIMTPQPVYPTGGTRIIAFGDSLVEGVGASEGNDFVSILSQRFEQEIINAGESGDTTGDGLARLEQDVLDMDPRVVLLLLGGNDVLTNVSQTETFENLERIIDRIHAHGSAVILIGIRGNLLFDTYKKEFATLAKEKQVWYVPDALKGLFGDSRYMSDQIHPNDAGYQVIADRVEPILVEVLTGS